MQVTSVRVSFLREKQPAQYEKAAPAVEFGATLDDGDDHRVAARNLMMDAASVVYAGIGYAVPDKVAAALKGGSVPAGLSVTAKTAEAPETAPEAPEEAAATEEDKPKTRGRPKGSKNTAPKKETAKAKREREEAEAAAAAEEVPGDEAVPGDDDAVPGDDVPAISTGESRVGPDDDPTDHDDAVPGDEAPAVGGTFTPKDLHTMITELVRATPRKLSVANAKQVLAHFKVARAQDLTDEQALEGKNMVEEMVAAAEVQGKA